MPKVRPHYKIVLNYSILRNNLTSSTPPRVLHLIIRYIFLS